MTATTHISTKTFQELFADHGSNLQRFTASINKYRIAIHQPTIQSQTVARYLNGFGNEKLPAAIRAFIKSQIDA